MHLQSHSSYPYSRMLPQSSSHTPHGTEPVRHDSSVMLIFQTKKKQLLQAYDEERQKKKNLNQKGNFIIIFVKNIFLF